jgi:hypothetical protein
MSVRGIIALPVSVQGNLITEFIELYHDASISRNYLIEQFEWFTCTMAWLTTKGLS